MSPTIAEAVDRFVAGAPVLLSALEGLSPEDLLARPIPGTWSIQEIIVHMWDSDLVASDRMKRVIAEETPLLVNFDESQAVARLGYDQCDVRLAADLFRLNRLYMGSILRRQSDETFSRFGIHTQAGKKTLLDLVNTYADHLDGHMVHLRRKRELLGKPLA
jgi:hypothetical protein